MLICARKPGCFTLNQQEAEYLLIGGYALFAHGYHRATTDVDLLVPATRQAGERIKAALMVLPDRSARDIDPDWFVEGENIRVADAFDIMLNACGETYETLKQFAETIDLDGLPIRTVNLEGLLRTKQTMRDNRVLPARSLDDLFWPTTSLTTGGRLQPRQRRHPGLGGRPDHFEDRQRIDANCQDQQGR